MLREGKSNIVCVVTISACRNVTIAHWPPHAEDLPMLPQARYFIRQNKRSSMSRDERERKNPERCPSSDVNFVPPIRTVPTMSSGPCGMEKRLHSGPSVSVIWVGDGWNSPRGTRTCARAPEVIKDLTFERSSVRSDRPTVSDLYAPRPADYVQAHPSDPIIPHRVRSNAEHRPNER